MAVAETEVSVSSEDTEKKVTKKVRKKSKPVEVKVYGKLSEKAIRGTLDKR